MSSSEANLTWTCFGPSAGHCRVAHATRDDAERHARDDRREMQRLGRADLADREAHRVDCDAIIEGRREACDCGSRR